MYCFLQIKLIDPETPHIPIERTIRVSDIDFVHKMPNGNAAIFLFSSKMPLNTTYSYEDLLETLSGFQKVELIEVLNDQDAS